MIANICHRPVARDTEKDCMGKILSFGYLDDWQKDRERWDEKQKKLQEAANKPSKPEIIHSEYQDSMTSKGLVKAKTPLKPIQWVEVSIYHLQLDSVIVHYIFLDKTDLANTRYQ